jgi:hypothetical protein
MFRHVYFLPLKHSNEVFAVLITKAGSGAWCHSRVFVVFDSLHHVIFDVSSGLLE